MGIGFPSFQDRVGHAQWVVELLASWRGEFGSHHNLEVSMLKQLFIHEETSIYTC